MRKIILGLCAIIIAATASACGGHDMKMISVTEGVIYPPFPGQTTAASFFTLSNTLADDRLIAVKSPLSETVEIHTHIHSDQGMKMVKTDGVNVPMGAKAFKSGGDHIMIFNVDADAMPSEAVLTLVFETAGEVNVTLPILPHGEDPKALKMDHSGH